MKTSLRVGAVTVAAIGCLSACTSPGETTATSASLENSCINPTHITRQEIVSDREIRFELRNGEVWMNRLPRDCPSLKFQQGFTWDVRGTLVCSNQQTIYVKDDGTPCQLGVFTRMPEQTG